MAECPDFNGSDGLDDGNPPGSRGSNLRGVGIGFLSSFEVEGRYDMVQIFPNLEDWHLPLWLVTHVDLHRTAKVQTMLSFIKRYRSLAASL